MPSKTLIKDKEMEYDDAPSGFVKLYSYKEPFMPFHGAGIFDIGYGFEGVLLFDGKSDKIQCHFCGDWYDFLPSHIRKEHSIKTSEYKELVGLTSRTALISEKVRTKMIANGKK